MPYNREIEARTKRFVSSWKNTDEKKMFGGVCHLLNGNMFCSVYKAYLIVRLGEGNALKALRSPYAKLFDITVRPMKGWVMIECEGLQSDDDLKSWLEKARAFANALPSK